MVNPLIPFWLILQAATIPQGTIALQQNNTRGFIAKDFTGELFFAR
jgi:hypothetical protein